MSSRPSGLYIFVLDIIVVFCFAVTAIRSSRRILALGLGGLLDARMTTEKDVSQRVMCIQLMLVMLKNRQCSSNMQMKSKWLQCKPR